MSSLLLHLIEVRSVFIQGGEGKLRQATLAFAAGIILLQRLSYYEGKTHAKSYGFALGAAITLFAMYHAGKFPAPIPSSVVFLVNMILFAVLWWVGHQISAACAVDSRENVTEAVESGIMTKFRTRLGHEPRTARADARVLDNRELTAKIELEKTSAEREAQWSERLSRRHPGLTLLYFSLFAIPAFGLGLWLFPKGEARANMSLGVMVFVYLWCAFALLCLSSLNQFRAYFEERDVSLPEMVGLTWLSLGFVVLCSVLVAAFLLPQPPSIATAFVRDRMVSAYRDIESRYGIKDWSLRGKGRGGRGTGHFPDANTMKQYFDRRYSNIDKMQDPYLSEMVRKTGVEPEFQATAAASLAFLETLKEALELFIKVLIYLIPVAFIFLIYVIIAAGWQSLSLNFARTQWMRRRQVGERRAAKRKKKKKGEELAPSRFAGFANPFAATYGESDGVAVVRYCWQATLALCTDFGTPCPPDRTPFEFVADKPQALEGFEESARFISQLFTFSEFSGQTVPDSSLAALKTFWMDLQKHAARVLS